MKTSHIIEIARKTIKQAAKNKNPTPPSILRLDEALLARTPSEDIGETTVEAIELYPRILQSIKAPGAERLKETIVIGIDSSSRLIDTPTASIIVASISISSNKKPGLGDWPPLYGNGIPGFNEPFITILPINEDYNVEDHEYVTTSNPAGIEYHGDYSVYQALDEARVRLENRALEAIADILEDAKPTSDVLILIDGPLYLVTGAITRPGVPYEYKKAWEQLSMQRIRAVSRLESAGARVYGVVKRIERASLLQKDPNLDTRIRNCLGDGRFNDKLILYRSLENRLCTRITPPNGGGYALTTPSLKIEYIGQNASKTAQYVVIPQPRWTPNPYASRYYRVEESYSSWLENEGRWHNYRSPVAGLLLDSVSRGTTEPVTIKYSDKRAKEITAYLKTIMVMEAARNNVPISYSNEIEVYQLWARVGA
ncbi:MAG: DNA double-strand break repair nuclease NurA [Desulfurococcales archaeon]|nr:DNA double-strand break repair nuclease NurA [Desulfurococcales archaeon]